MIANVVKPLGNLAMVPTSKAMTCFPWRFGGPTSIEPAELGSSSCCFATSAVILVAKHEFTSVLVVFFWGVDFGQQEIHNIYAARKAGSEYFHVMMSHE